MRTGMLVAIVAALVVCVGCRNDEPAVEPAASEPAAAGEDAASAANRPLPLPELTDCASTEHPRLPAKWRATALMQDFVRPALTFGNFTYDESVGAFRFRLKTEAGRQFDLLVTADRKLYMLHGGDRPNRCRFVMDRSPLTMPSRDWLDAKAECVGEAPILQRDVAWWKSPSGDGANWYWFGTGNALPFRTMFYEDAARRDPVPVYEHFTFNYFPVFEELQSTGLGAILDLCQAAGAENAATPADLGGFDVERPDAIASEAATEGIVDAETMATAQDWIPGLEPCSSPHDLPPAWPDKVQATAFMTAVSFPPNPFPTRVYYDWTHSPSAQNSSLYYYRPKDPSNHVQVALLKGDTGWIRIEDPQGRVKMCEQALPGPQVPNWKEVDGCRCRAELRPGSVLNPSSERTKILWCPTDLSANQVFWTWYSQRGRPVVFMQTNSSPTAGTGLNLADYYGWAPGSTAPHDTFDLPAACDGKEPIQVPKACHNCHLPLNE